MSSAVRTITGIEGSPARLAARQRLSPAISSKRSSASSRTRMGWSTPSSATEAVRLASDSSSKYRRGWLGFGLIEPTGNSLSPVPASPVMALGVRAPRPLPSPLRHGGGGGRQRFLGEVPAGLVGFRAYRAHRYLADPRTRLSSDVCGDHGPQAPTQPAAARHRSPPWPVPGRQWRPGSSNRTR